jgi:isoaspartyl peptidase/L-asparaginase-like protein (Ntn-hydrolase superfamily)
MKSRRIFLKSSALLGVGLALKSCAEAVEQTEKTMASGVVNKPIVLSTWRGGIKANEAAWEVLSKSGAALDAVERGVRVQEADPEDQSVGYGGRPDRDGHVTLDACIMDHEFNCGSVAFVQGIKHPITLARAVMEQTPHVMLAGKGAEDFAASIGMPKENLLTEKSKEDWENWKVESNYKPVANIENHDTIGMIALDANGNLSGACTTSGMAYKMHGRIGDSPIIGAALYVDNEIGAATATGHGEEVIRVTGCHLVVELMRQGLSPQKACEEAVRRIMHKIEIRKKNPKDLQVGFIALNKQGEYGAYCIQGGFNFAKYDNSGNVLIDADFELKE